ncbi:hypothetical protein OROHE_025456 [Orobanche hederae]
MDNEEVSLKEKGRNNDVVVEIGNSTSVHSPIPVSSSDFSAKSPAGHSLRKRPPLTKSAYSKPKSRIVEPPYPSNSKRVEQNAKTTPSRSPITRSPLAAAAAASPSSKIISAPITPRTPLMASIAGDDDDPENDNDDEVYTPKNLKLDRKVKRGKKVRLLLLLEWVAFVSITAVLVASLTVTRLEDWRIAGLNLWKWCVLVLVVFCGSLFTEWLTNLVVFLIEKNFLLKKKVLYFVFALRTSVGVVIWLALILLAWTLLINRGARRSEETSRVLNYITRGIVSTLVGAVLWTVKTLLVKIVASSFHVKTYFDRIQESIFHQYILQALSGSPTLENESSKISSGRLMSFSRVVKGKQEANVEVINVDKLYKMKREKVSAWTMGGLINAIRNSDLLTVSEVLDGSDEEESGKTKVITSEVEARESANRIFRNVAKPHHKYIDEDDLLLFMPKEEVDNAIPLFEGATESRRIKRSSFRNWVVKTYNERKCLVVTLSDAKTAIEELNKVMSVLILLVILIVWLLLMEITSTKVLVVIASQILVVVVMFGSAARSLFEAIIFIFVVHPFDVGDWCVIDGVQMVVDEMNLSTTIFLKANNEKIYYPNKVLASIPISNYNRSPEMGDCVEFAVDFSTSIESVAALKAKIKGYIDSKPQHWNPSHNMQIKEIVDVNKMMMALYVTHTINFQNTDRHARRSDLVFQLKNIFEELGIKYRLLPQEVQISYAGSALPSPSTVTRQ